MPSKSHSFIDSFFARETHKFHLLQICLLSLFIAVLSGCDSSKESKVIQLGESVENGELLKPKMPNLAKNEYYFGFDVRNNPQEDARQYLPFLNYLEQETGYKFKLRFTSKNNSTEDDLGQGVTQFAAIGATASIYATEKYQAIPLVRGINSLGKAEYQSMIVIAPDSKLRKLEDLRGKRFAFGSENSTQGHLIPRIILSNKGLNLKDFDSHIYTGSHLNCANAVVSKKADACGMQDTMAEAMSKEGTLHILHISDYYPSSGISANKNVSPQVLEKVKQALINFKPRDRHKEGLYNWDKTEMPNGFVPADEKNYEDLRNWMIKLKFLETNISETQQDKKL